MGFGYDDSQLREGRHPTRDDLDRVSAELPVIVIHQSGHLGAANSRALEAAGVSAATDDPTGGVFRRREGGREPDGVLEEHAFFHVLGASTRRFDGDANLAMIRAGTEFYARFGYTTCQEARAFGDAIPRMREAADRGVLPIDLLAYPDIVAAAEHIKAPALSRDYRDRFRIGGAKLTIDGSPQGKTAWLTRPYHVPPPGQRAAYVGYPALPSDRAFAAVEQAFAEGWQLLCHCNGDAAADLYIAAVLEATRRHGPAQGRRPVLIHGDVLPLVPSGGSLGPSGVITHPPLVRGSRCDGLQDGAEDAGARREAGGVDHGAHVRLSLSRPHRAVAVGDLALDHGGAEVALAGVVRHPDPAGPVHEGQKLVTRSPQLRLQRPRQLAPAGGCQDRVQPALERPPLGGQGGGGQACRGVGQVEG